MNEIEKTAIRISINSLSVKDLVAAMKSKLGYIAQELNILEIAVDENESSKKFLAANEIARDLNVINAMSEALTRHCPAKQHVGVFHQMPSTLEGVEEHGNILDAPPKVLLADEVAYIDSIDLSEKVKELINTRIEMRDSRAGPKTQQVAIEKPVFQYSRAGAMPTTSPR